MKSLMLAFSVLIFSTCVMAQTTLAGISNLPFDQWTKSLKENTDGATFNSTQVGQDLEIAVGDFKTSQQLFQQILLLGKNYKINNWEQAKILAEQLLRARQSVRQNKSISISLKRETLFVIQMMAEEVLYVGQKKFKVEDAELVVMGTQAASPKSNLLRQFRVQTGDVMLSKSTGSGSSSFIALSMQNPHIYSHSAPVYVEGPQNKLFSPEAFIEDGVKLRNLKTEYIDGSKTRLSIYRYRGLDISDRMKVWKDIEQSTEDFIQLMKSKVGDIEKESSFGYDFKMDPSKTDKSFFCSGVAYTLYPKSGEQAVTNPYRKDNWSQIVGGRRSLMSTLGIDSDRMPAPGDLEVNSLFELVGFRLDLQTLQQERVEQAIVDNLLQALESNQADMLKIQESLQNLGNQPLQKADILMLVESGLLPPEMQKAVQEKEAEIPTGINLKQLIFFAGMNEWIVPETRAQILELLKAADAQGEIWGPIQLRNNAAVIVNTAIEKAAEKLQAAAQEMDRQQLQSEAH